MTPILFDINEYNKLITNNNDPVISNEGMFIAVGESLQTEFTNLGIGALADAISCNVIEERNGIYELEMKYPITGKHFNDLIISRIIVATPSYKKTPQPFRIYKITKPISGIITVYAEHMSYRLSHIPVMPFTASNVHSALDGLKENAAEVNPFEFYTDLETIGEFKNELPQSCRALLGGVRGSILDVYGGEYEFDKYTVKLLKNRGADRGVEIRYGKNLTDLTQEESIENTITGICPYWKNDSGEFVTLPEKVVHSRNATKYPYNRTVTKDFSTEFDERPTEAQLRAYARNYIDQTGIGVPKVSIKVSFVHLAQFEEYKHLELLETVGMCDTVTVVFDALGVNAKAKVVKTDYDVLADKYNSVSVGSIETNLVKTLEDVQEAERETILSSTLEQAKSVATSIMEGGGKGYVYMDYDEEHILRSIMIMDTNDPLTALKRWVWNENGFGYATRGSISDSWQYKTAMTMDGQIVADFITTGSMTSNEVKVGGWELSQNAFHGGSDRRTEYSVEQATNNVSKIQSIILGTSFPSAEDYIALDITATGDLNLVDSVYFTRRKLGYSTALASAEQLSAQLSSDGVLRLADRRQVIENGSEVMATGVSETDIYPNCISTGAFIGINAFVSNKLSAKDIVYTTLNQASDERLKEDIIELPNSLVETLKKLKPSSYYYKHDESKKSHYGLIAQNVLESGLDAPVSGDDYLSLDYTQLIPVLIKGWQDHERRIEELEKGLNDGK